MYTYLFIYSFIYLFTCILLDRVIAQDWPCQGGEIRQICIQLLRWGIDGYSGAGPQKGGRGHWPAQSSWVHHWKKTLRNGARVDISQGVGPRAHHGCRQGSGTGGFHGENDVRVPGNSALGQSLGLGFWQRSVQAVRVHPDPATWTKNPRGMVIWVRCSRRGRWRERGNMGDRLVIVCDSLILGLPWFTTLMLLGNLAKGC